ncbi:hypothetical protein DRJ16_07605, partial [Candidatus Woesearchaeota archaeon]
KIKELCELLEDDYVIDAYAEDLGLEFKKSVVESSILWTSTMVRTTDLTAYLSDYLDLKTASIKENGNTELPPISDNIGGGSSSLGIWSETR